MVNNKENKLDQIKHDLGEIESNAKSLKIQGQKKNKIPDKHDLETETLVLTEIIEEGHKTDVNLSKNEIILKLRDIKSIMEIQNKILSDLINKLS